MTPRKNEYFLNPHVNMMAFHCFGHKSKHSRIYLMFWSKKHSRIYLINCRFLAQILKSCAGRIQRFKISCSPVEFFNPGLPVFRETHWRENINMSVRRRRRRRRTRTITKIRPARPFRLRVEKVWDESANLKRSEQCFSSLIYVGRHEIPTLRGSG